MINLHGIHISGALINPARSLGLAVMASGKALSQLWLFIVAPLLGGAAARLLACRDYSARLN